jgi:hypothetical protein
VPGKDDLARYDLCYLLRIRADSETEIKTLLAGGIGRPASLWNWAFLGSNPR